MTLRDRFNSKGFGINAYVKAHNINQTTLSLVLDGKLKGSNVTAQGNTKKVITQLYRDNIWIAPLPWRDNNECH